MKFADPLVFKVQKPRTVILYAGSQLQGPRETQEDYFINFNDECFVIADGVSGVPHGDVAAHLASETAVWGYKHIRHRKFYWDDKKKLLKRIFRSANIAVWQKHRETGFEQGLASTLSVVIVGPNKVWVGNVGDSPVYLYRDGLIDVLTTTDLDTRHRLTNAIGLERYGLVPHIKIDHFLSGDIIFMATDGVTSFVSEDEIRMVCDVAGKTTKSMTEAVIHLLELAQKNGSTDNMTACIISRQLISE